MVLVVPAVEMNLFWIDQEEGKEDNEYLKGLFASVYEVPVEHVGLGRRRKAILSKQGTGGCYKGGLPMISIYLPTQLHILSLLLQVTLYNRS